MPETPSYKKKHTVSHSQIASTLFFGAVTYVGTKMAIKKTARTISAWYLYGTRSLLARLDAPRIAESAIGNRPMVGRKPFVEMPVAIRRIDAGIIITIVIILSDRSELVCVAMMPES